MDQTSMKQQGLLAKLEQGISAQPPTQKAQGALQDGSTTYTTTESSYLRHYLSDLDLRVLRELEAEGITFTHLKESQVVDQFL